LAAEKPAEVRKFDSSSDSMGIISFKATTTAVNNVEAAAPAIE
jgi:hypothetical protein